MPRIFRVLETAACTVVAATLLSASAGADTQALPELITIDDSIAQTPAGAELQAALATHAEIAGSGDPALILESAKRIVLLTSRATGDDSPQTAAALVNLAIAQSADREYAASKQNYESAINILETQDSSIIGDALINPLQGLASTLVALGDVESSVEHFERAIHLTHVHSGPNNLRQVDLMRQLSRAYLALDEEKDANAVQENLYQVQLRNFDENSDNYLDAVLSRARWYREIGNYGEASESYKKYRRHVVKTYGRNDPRLIEPMTELALTDIGDLTGYTSDYTSFQSRLSARRRVGVAGAEQLDRANLQGMTPILRERILQQNQEARRLEARVNEKRQAMRQALRIAKIHSEDDPERYARTLINDGDFKLSFDGNARRARASYRRAWLALDEVDNGEVLQQRMLGQPAAVMAVPIPRFPDNEKELHPLYDERGFVEIAYDLDRLGRPDNIRVVASEPAGLMDRVVAGGFNQYRFRPAFRDGESVRATDMTFRHDFRFSTERLTPKQRQRIADTQAARIQLQSNSAKVTSDTAEAAKDQL